MGPIGLENSYFQGLVKPHKVVILKSKSDIFDRRGAILLA